MLKWTTKFDISTCKDVHFVANVKDISFRLKTTMIDNGDGTQNSYFCPKYLTINMNNTIFQSEKIHDKVSVNNSKVYSAYQKSVVTTTTDPVIGKISVDNRHTTHSRMEHYFFSYLLTCEVYLIEVLEIMAQMLQYIIFLSLKAIKVSSDFILN